MTNNPFASIDLRCLRVEKKPHKSVVADLPSLLDGVDVSKAIGIRNRLILLLRLKYSLRPSEISNLNLADIDLDTRLVKMPNRKRNPFIVIDEKDLIDFRRWLLVRRLYTGNSDSLIISLHWTSAIATPYQRISVRAIHKITSGYLKRYIVK